MLVGLALRVELGRLDFDLRRTPRRSHSFRNGTVEPTAAATGAAGEATAPSAAVPTPTAAEGAAAATPVTPGATVITPPPAAGAASGTAPE